MEYIQNIAKRTYIQNTYIILQINNNKMDNPVKKKKKKIGERLEETLHKR